ncbi:MAG: cell envelope integrity protein CreD [Xanthomonadales bacterium]|nr:cell envelope integrity protein CreD [Xanthomonadales bacterium]
MNVSNLLTRNRATLKLLFVGVLSLAMSFPLLLVRSIISERQDLQLLAEQTITDRWGSSQTISGLVAVVNASEAHVDQRSIKTQRQWRASVPADLSISAELTTQWRYLGIYKVPVYTALLQITGRIEVARLNDLQPEGDLLLWLPLGDLRGVREVSPLIFGPLELEASPMSVLADKYTGLQFLVPAADRERLSDTYRLEIRLAGSHSLQFLPLADSTHVNLKSDWPHPEFIGQFLPAERNIDAGGAQASWQLMGLNRPYGNNWLMSGMSDQQLSVAGFGMRLETPVDSYQRSERSVKYGFLFITMTFFTLFLFEVLTGRPLHPVPYILTGAALALFYLVLLALSEYISFTGSFVLAAGLLLLIITPYTGVVLGGRNRGVLVGAMMGITYCLLYVLVSAQHLALLLGSLALLVAVAGLMFLTRNVDWNNYGVGE